MSAASALADGMNDSYKTRRVEFDPSTGGALNKRKFPDAVLNSAISEGSSTSRS